MGLQYGVKAVYADALFYVMIYLILRGFEVLNRLQYSNF